jgi:hypothetical protein
MVKSKSSYKETFMYCNVLIFMGLLGIYCYLTKDVKEGIRNMGCCGGIEAGVHYSETDTKPPPYVKRCFKKRDDGSYNWSGFPCTGSKSDDCCYDKDGYGRGDCVPTSRGGYCKANDDFIFRGSTTKPYIKRGGDELLDINDANDMKDYFYDRGEKQKGTSVEMQRFLARRTKNEKYMEDHLRDRRKSEQKGIDESTSKLKDQSKKIELITTITIIHLLFLVIFSIVIREEIIQKIDGFYQLMYMQYLKFTGKSV